MSISEIIVFILIKLFFYLKQKLSSLLIVVIFGLRCLLYDDGLRTEQAVAVAVDSDLLAKTVSLVDSLPAALKGNDLLASPVGCQAVATVEILAGLEAKRAVWQASNLLSHPRVLSWVIALPSANDFVSEDKNEKVNGHDKEEQVEDHAHPVGQICGNATLETRLLIRQLIIRIESILQQEEKEEEWVQADDEDDNGSCVLVFTPVLVCVISTGYQGAPKLIKATEESCWCISQSVQGSKPDHHDQSETLKPL